eukprot:s777_g47.t1
MISVPVDMDGHGVEVLSQLQMGSSACARAASLLALRLGSGRRHQLRSHCAHVGHPTVNICPRNFLHRYRLAFNDSTGERQDLIEDLAAVLLQVMGKDHVSACNRDSCMDGLRDWSLLLCLKLAASRDNETSLGTKESFEEVEVQGYGPGGAAVVIEAMTDNMNRTRSAIKDAFKEVNGEARLGNRGAWKKW